MFRTTLFAASALAVVTLAAAPAVSFAAPQEYRFELAGQPVKSGKDTIVKVKLIHAPDNTPVPDAVLIQPKADMGPDGMATMTTAVKVLSPAEPGVYQVQVEQPMAGKWALSLAAKVQGEPETVRGTVVVTLAK
jgi:hypothetical protein